MITKNTLSTLDCSIVENEYRRILNEYNDYDANYPTGAAKANAPPKNEILLNLTKAENAFANCLLKYSKLLAEKIKRNGHNINMNPADRISNVQQALAPCSILALVASNSMNIDKALATKRYAQLSLCISNAAVILQDPMVCDEAKNRNLFEKHGMKLDFIGSITGLLIKDTSDPNFMPNQGVYERALSENGYKICKKEVEKYLSTNQNIQCYTIYIIFILPLFAALFNLNIIKVGRKNSKNNKKKF
ncbi:MAG: hypothetical protein QXO21_05090 [Candidatus Anstonellales archaeon]